MTEPSFNLLSPPVASNSLAHALPNTPSQRGLSALLGTALLLGLLFLGACGPVGGGNAVDTSSAEEQTRAVATTFAADGNLETARAAIDALDVANPGQWLIFMTEGALADPSFDPALKQALVKLTLALGYKEATIEAYAQANGLADAAGNLAGSQAAADAATVAAAIAAPVPAPVPVVEPVAAAPVAAAPALTTTAPLTTVAALTPTAVATVQPVAAQATANELVNLRAGPGVEYGLAGSLGPGEAATITGKNSAGDWWQVQTAVGATAWVYAQLVASSGAVESVAVAAEIPVAPTATPAPIAAAPVGDVAAPPAAVAPTEAAPAAPTAPAASPSDQPTFRMIDRHMWAKADNGDCRGQHLLRIIVVDANGAPLNGVTLQGIYTGAVLVTGSQGKGDGRIEYDLYGTGEGFRVIKDADGREAISDNAEGFTTKSLDIDQATLIAGGYCTNDSDCQDFYASYGCTGHHSWEATFQRNF